MRKIIITGAGGGLGSSTVKKLLHNKKLTLYCIDSSQDALDFLPKSNNIVKINNDLSDSSQCLSLVKNIGGEIAGLIHFAGTLEKDLDLSADPNLWDRVINSNLKSAYDLTGAIMRHLDPVQHINFLYFSGIAYRRGAYENVAYSIAKSGIVGLTRSIAKKLGPRGVANALCPGVIMTHPRKNNESISNISLAMNEYLSRHQERILAQIPMKRFGDPNEVAEAVSFFISEKCSYITGQVINIDGGIINS